MLRAACATQTFHSGFAGFLIIAALIFNKVYTGLGATTMIRQLVLGLDPNPLLVIAVLSFLSSFWACSWTTSCLVHVPCPSIFPINNLQAGILSGFGVLFVVNMQMASILPYGLNLFYMKAVARNSAAQGHLSGCPAASSPFGPCS